MGASGDSGDSGIDLFGTKGLEKGVNDYGNLAAGALSQAPEQGSILSAEEKKKLEDYQKSLALAQAQPGQNSQTILTRKPGGSVATSGMGY